MKGSKADRGLLDGARLVRHLAPRVCPKVAGRSQRWLRYGIVAAACALLHNFIMIGFDRLGAHYVLCQTVSAAVLLPVGYSLQAQVTFGTDRSWRSFGRYSAALITNYPVAIAVLWLLCDILKLDMIWASPVSMVVLLVWNYATSNWALSRRRAHVGSSTSG